jgi:hypothetical protein
MKLQRARTLGAGALFAAAAWLIAVWASGPDASQSRAAGTAIALPDLTLGQPADAARFTETLQHPLFSPDRRALPPPTQTDEAAANTSPATKLIAVAIGPDRSAAILKLTSGNTSVLMQGQQIDGWTLASVAPHQVTLRSGSLQAQLVLPGGGGQ